MTETKELKPLPKAPAGGIVRTSLDNSWQTPQFILDCARAYFGGAIPLDPASAPANPTKALEFWTDGGIERSWDKPAWCNPPYGRELRDWMAKMIAESRRGTPIISLLPCSRWEQAYMHDLIEAATVVCWIRKRVNFISSIDGEAVGGNPYASMVLGMQVDPVRFTESFKRIGLCVFMRPLGRNDPNAHIGDEKPTRRRAPKVRVEK